MEEIRIISSSIVHQATQNESTRVLELTPWDLRLLGIGYGQQGLLFLKPPHEKYSQHTFLNHLKTSLIRTLDFFPPLAGRLVSISNDDNTTSFFIDCNNAGAQFVHATTNDIKVADILTPFYVPDIVSSFFPLNGILNHNGVTEPLLGVQVTELVDGVFIGCTINHSVVDGTSFWHFFNSWSEISCGLATISKLPNFKRFSLDDTEPRIRIPSSENQLVMEPHVIPRSLKQRVFHFSKESICKLKAKANAEMGTNQISSLQALLAHIWRSIVRCNDIETTEKLRPPLPEGYFGNAARGREIKIAKNEMAEHGLGWTAWKINRVVASETEEELRKFYEDWAKCPKIIKMGAFTNIRLYATNSPRFNVYGNDFGWGRPVAVRSGVGNKFDGKVTMFAGREEGSMDIEICLIEQTMASIGDIHKDY